ncbi:MAG TPA: FadR/GntR family transcriptional regulator [Bacilli bacterium]
MLSDKLVQIEKVTLAQNIVQQLIEIIMNGTIKPGDKLPAEKQLMELFGVGRSSLREAIRALITLGLVEVKVPEGTFVSKSLGGFFTKHLALMSRISFDNIIDLVEARIAIEVDIAEIAARKATQEDNAKLNEVLISMREAKENEQFLSADLQFHLILAEIAKNSFMLHVMNILRDVTREWILKVIQLPTTRELATKQHEKIAKAIKNNDVAAAGTAMREHLEAVSELLMKKVAK